MQYCICRRLINHQIKHQSFISQRHVLLVDVKRRSMLINLPAFLDSVINSAFVGFLFLNICILRCTQFNWESPPLALELFFSMLTFNLEKSIQ